MREQVGDRDVLGDVPVTQGEGLRVLDDRVVPRELLLPRHHSRQSRQAVQLQIVLGAANAPPRIENLNVSIGPEAQNPLVVTEATGRAAPDAAPAGNATRQIRAVVTIEGLDRQSQTLTVKDSRGKYFVTRVADPSRLEQVHIGDTIVLTFTEATAISLNPA